MANYNGILTREVLNLFLVIDTSTSMNGARIGQVNSSFKDLSNSLKQFASDHNVQINLRVIAFNDEPTWIIGNIESGVDIENVVWKNLTCYGCTNTAKALEEVNKALKVKFLGAHALRPVVTLITDGYCNADDHPEYLNQIEIMKKKLSGTTGTEKVTRVAIGVKQENKVQLEEFASLGKTEDFDGTERLIKLVYNVDDPDDLAKTINWTVITSLYSSLNTDNNDEIIIIDDDKFDE